MHRPAHPIIALALFVAIPLGAQGAADDAYAALKRFDGTWNATFSTGRTLAVENHCWPTAHYFVCEQTVGGGAAALVIFQAAGGGDGALKYRTRTLTSAEGPIGPWGSLTITGDRWVYEPGATSGRAKRTRTVDIFSGPDFIHFEDQTSTGGQTWTTARSGDERRAP